MADHQRSENGNQVVKVHHHPPQFQRIVPVIYSTPPPKRGYFYFCKCICCTMSLLLLLLIILGAISGTLYLVFKPNLPIYSIDSLRISDLRLNYDMTIYAKFDVKITASNPNKKIGIYYEKRGRVSVWYKETKLCEGSLPIFYQGHQNKTLIDVSLSGEVESGSTLMKGLQEQQQTGRVPLELKVDAPMAIELGRLKLRKVRILCECMLVVDSLLANNLITIKASNCSFRLKL